MEASPFHILLGLRHWDVLQSLTNIHSITFRFVDLLHAATSGLCRCLDGKCWNLQTFLLDRLDNSEIQSWVGAMRFRTSQWKKNISFRFSLNTSLILPFEIMDHNKGTYVSGVLSHQHASYTSCREMHLLLQGLIYVTRHLKICLFHRLQELHPKLNNVNIYCQCKVFAFNKLWLIKLHSVITWLER